MKEGNNIIQFNAADIERYHKGLMNDGEMHALEKAALDDPFLADALDGYRVAAVDTSNDLNDLRNRLTKRTGAVTMMARGKKSSFPFLRIAAMIVVIAGAGLLTYTILNNKKEVELAKNADNQTQAEKINPVNSLNVLLDKTNRLDSLTGASASSVKDVNNQELKSENLNLQVSDSLSDYYSKSDTSKINVNVANTTRNAGEVASAISAPSAVLNNPSINAGADDKRKKEPDLEIRNRKDATAKEEIKLNEVVVPGKSKTPDDNMAVEKLSKRSQRDVGLSRDQYKTTTDIKDTFNYSRLNIFRGRVTDAFNNGIPFANVTISDVNVGTYADAKGNFSLVAPDSTLNVNLRAVGFNNSQIQLRNLLPTNQVVLQEDNSLTAIVINSNKPNANRSRSSNIILTEPEPSDGWENYDSYLANNLKVPEEKERLRKNGEVEVSFEVNSKGEPVNITVTKSLCKECDKEAVRLIKDGPGWKRKNKKEKARVTVAF